MDWEVKQTTNDINMYKVGSLSKCDAHKEKADTRYGVDFQGKKIHPIASMTYWYRWGEYTFDIRALRAARGKKETMAIDTDFHIHPCTRFQKIAKEIMELVGEVPFTEVFSKTI